MTPLTPDILYEGLLDYLYDGVYVMDTERRILMWNRGAERISGYRSGEVVGRSCADNILNHVSLQGDPLCLQGCPAAQTLQDGKLRELEAYLHHKDGHRVPVSIRLSPLRDPDGRIVGTLEIFSDNAASMAMRHRLTELEKMSMLDPLTGLPNRRSIEMNLRSRREELERYGVAFGVLFIDIDHFKRINDAHGHDVGDRVLKMTSGTLFNAMRSFDVVGRWGGEEFVALVINVDRKRLLHVAERCRALIEQSSIRVREESVRVTVSIGAALARRGDTVDALLRRADERMYLSKAAGRNRVTLPRPESPAETATP